MSWTGWHRLDGKGHRWREVVTAATYDTAWDAFLELVPAIGSGEAMVLKAGEHPTRESSDARTTGQVAERRR